MDAVVFRLDNNPSGEIWVSLRVLGVEIDLAGPFDDTTEAVQMAERAVYDHGHVDIWERA